MRPPHVQGSARVLIEATTAEHARGGIGVVVAGLMSALAEDSAGYEATFLLGPTTETPRSVNVQTVNLARSSVGRILYQRLLLPTTATARTPSVNVIFMDSFLPLWGTPGLTGRSTVFVHDVLPLTHPEFYDSRKDVVKRLAYATIRRRRPDVVTSCDFTALEIERTLGIRPRVARFGCGQFTDDEADLLLTEAPQTRGNVVLYVGNLDSRKGLRSLISAVEMAAGKDASLTLAIVGNWRTADGLALRRWVASRRLGRVRFLGRLGKAETLDLLKHARALVYPAVAEGFGLPVLESLAVGTPTIASDIEVIRSWAGDCATYFPAGDEGALADAILESASAQAERRVAWGRDLSTSYRWRAFATALLKRPLA